MSCNQERQIINQHKLWLSTNGKQGKYGTIKNKTYTNIVFSNEDLTHLNINTCTFRNCHFSELKLLHTHFFHCNFENCVIINCDCTEIDINDCKFDYVTFENLIFVKSYFRSCEYKKIKFVKCVMFDASFINNVLDNYSRSAMQKEIQSPRNIYFKLNNTLLNLTIKMAIEYMDKKESESTGNETDFSY